MSNDPPSEIHRTSGNKLRRFARRAVIGLATVLVLGWLILVLWMPIRIHNKLVLPTEPAVEQVATSTVPEEMVDLYGRFLDGLQKEGFESVGWFQVKDLSPGTVTFFGLASHRDERVIGGALGIARPTEEGLKLMEYYLELSTHLSDVEIATNNVGTPSSFTPSLRRQVVSLPEIDDPTELYRRHLDRLQGHGISARQIVPEANDMIPHLVSDLVDELDGQVETGMLFRDDANRQFRPTWKGALLMSWRHIWPLSWVL